MTRNAQDIIDDMRNIVKPRIAKMLLEANFEGCGKEDKAEFETEFEMLLTLAERGATVEPQEWISPTAEPVSTEEAKKLLYQEFKGKMKDGNPRLLVAYEIAMKALEAQTEWISVKDRLPSKNDCYLVTFDFVSNGNPDNGIGVVEFYDGNFYSNGFGVNEDVVAWYIKPVPSPYKGDKE